ncbi:ankyrin repeat-containing protein-like isoform X1 [Iris pallida]|nr:ankyrin repeat-containing protein-like isoform X1 [Iris pallida]
MSFCPIHKDDSYHGLDCQMISGEDSNISLIIEAFIVHCHLCLLFDVEVQFIIF